ADRDHRIGHEIEQRRPDAGGRDHEHDLAGGKHHHRDDELDPSAQPRHGMTERWLPRCVHVVSLTVLYSGRISGNRITSRIDGWPVSSMTTRSTPTPSPAAGGMPTSSARQ